MNSKSIKSNTYPDSTPQDHYDGREEKTEEGAVMCTTQLTRTARVAVGSRRYVAATPQFNTKCLEASQELAESWNTECFVNVPSFGVNINQACSEFLPFLAALAKELGEPLPGYTFNTKAHEKLGQIAVLTAAARAAGHSTWADHVDAFVAAISSESAESITSNEVWHTVLERAGVRPDYPEFLHYDRMHELFDGITAEQLKALRETEHSYPSSDGSKTYTATLENFSLRWLSNAFKLWDFKGSQADVVNTVFALLNRGVGAPVKVSENEVLSVLAEMKRRLETGDFADLVYFSEAVTDFEQDDRTAWLLLLHIARTMGRECALTVLLPPDGEHSLGRNKKVVLSFQPLREQVERLGGTHIVDQDSRNASALNIQNRGLVVKGE